MNRLSILTSPLFNLKMLIQQSEFLSVEELSKLQLVEIRVFKMQKVFFLAYFLLPLSGWESCLALMSCRYELAHNLRRQENINCKLINRTDRDASLNHFRYCRLIQLCKEHIFAQVNGFYSVQCKVANF